MSRQEVKNCPVCLIGRLTKRQGKYGDFFGCDRYPDCNYIQKTPKIYQTKESDADSWAREHGRQLDPII